MKPRSYKDSGFVIFAKNYREADKLISLLAKKYGYLTLLAKGVRKIRSKKRSSLQQFSEINFSAARGKGIDILTETEIISSNSNLKKDLQKASVAYFMSEAVGRLVPSDENAEGVYLLYKKYIKHLKTTKSLKKLRVGFAEKLVKELGYYPKDKSLKNPDMLLNTIAERQFYTVRVGKKVLS